MAGSCHRSKCATGGRACFRSVIGPDEAIVSERRGERLLLWPDRVPLHPSPGQAVLVVDADVQMRDMTMYAVRDLGVAVRDARNRSDALEAARMMPPTVIVTCVELDGTAVGPSIARTCRRKYGSGVVFTSGRLAPQHLDAVAAIEDGALLCKPIRIEQLQATLRVMLQRARLVRVQDASPATPAATDLARALRQIAGVVAATGLLTLDRPTSAPVGPMLAMLRPREQEVVRLLFAHVRVPGIARQLRISPQTVRNHLKRIFQQLGVHSQQELIVRLQQTPRPGAGNDAPDVPDTWTDVSDTSSPLRLHEAGA